MLNLFRRTKNGQDQRQAEFAPAAVLPGSGEGFNSFDVGLENAAADGWYNKELGELAPGFPISRDDTLVDVGCGDAGMCVFCAAAGADITLIDADPGRVEEAARRLAKVGAKMGAKIRGHGADAARLPLADHSMSRVICTEVLEHVEDPGAVMAELVRIGRPGALYLLSVPGAVGEHLQAKLALPEYFQKPNHIRIFDDDAFDRLVTGAGLTIERRSSVGFYWTLWWVFFWQTGKSFTAEIHDPLLHAWANAWRELLHSPNGARTKQALDNFAPKSQVIVARKPL